MYTENLSLPEFNLLFQRMLNNVKIHYKTLSINYKDKFNNTKCSYRYHLRNNKGLPIVVDVMDDNSRVDKEAYTYYRLSPNTLVDKAIAVFSIYFNKEVLYPRMLEYVNDCLKE